MTDTPRAEPMKPCPFCGQEPWGVFGPDEKSGACWVECHGPDDSFNCGNWHHTADSDDWQIARAETRVAWNRRAEVEASRLPLADIHSCSPFCERPECVKDRAGAAPSDAAVQPQGLEEIRNMADALRARGYKVIGPSPLPTAPAGAREAMEKAHEEILGAIEMTAYGRHPMAATCVNLAEKILRAALAAAPLERIAPDTARLDWLFANCRIVFFHPPASSGGTYPIEHNPFALGCGNKRDSTPILQFADAAIEAEHGITLAQKGDVNG
jgi:hypothetical protein